MFGKFFASTFTGSMMAAGPEIFSVWGYVIAHAVDSRVELNPRLLAAVIGSTPEKMVTAIEYLCAPDTDSRSKECDGCRLIREGEFQYFIPNHAKYRSIRDESDRREYNRIKKREERSRKSNVKPSVNDGQRQSTMSAQAEAEAEAEADTKIRSLSLRSSESALSRSPKTASGTRLPETWRPDEGCRAFAADRGMDPDATADAFVDYWTANNGKTAIKRSWNAAFRTWCRRAATDGPMGKSTARPIQSSRGGDAFLDQLAIIASRSSTDDRNRK